MSHRRLPVWKTLAVMAVDVAAIGLGLALAYGLRFKMEIVPLRGEYAPADYLWLFPWAWFFWFLALRFENIYRRRSPVLDFNVVRRIVTGSIFALLFILAFIFYHRRVTDFSRVFIPIVFVVVVACLVLGRIALHRLFDYLNVQKKVGLTRTAIVGAGRVGRRIYQLLAAHPEHGMAPVGLIGDPDVEVEAAPDAAIPLLGTALELEAILERDRIDEVVIVQPEVDRARIPAILLQCEQRMAAFRVVPDMTGLLVSGMTVEMLNGIPFLGARQTPLQGWNAALKRMIDCVAAAAGLVVISPILLAIAAAIKLDDGGSVFYTQRRMGIDGRKFKIWKFRSMRPGAENQTGPVFADDDDPRCTKVGRILRRYRLDELPQLFNVVTGEMSLVGPRPERPYFIEQFRDIPQYMVRHNVKSGITGWAQINGFSGKRGSIAERLEHDLYYIENWSIWLDFKILVLTFFPSLGRAA